MTISFQGRPPPEAVDYFARQTIGGRFSFNWRDTWQEEHLNAFVVAKAMSADVLSDIHGGLRRAMDEGWTKERFIQELTPLLQARGWWGKQKVTDPKTGEQQLAQLGSARRLDTIFDTNMRMAHSAGRWERIKRSASTRPFLEYMHTDQQFPRPWHLACNGIVLPVDHPFWETHATPNGWRCKCWIRSLRKAEAVTSEEELKRRGVLKTVAYRNKRTGVTTRTPIGVDPGFGYNPGKARLDALTPPVLPEPQRPSVIGPRNPASLPPAPPPRPPTYGARLRLDLAGDADRIWQAFQEVMGLGEGEIFNDRANVPVVISRALFQRKAPDGTWLADKASLESRGRYAEILAATLRDPDEIWYSLQAMADGSSHLVRTYVAAYDLGQGERQWFLISYSQRGGVWYGSTAFAPAERHRPDKALNYLNQFGRVGALVYRRK